MKLEKAIEILELAKDDPDSIDINDLFEAQDLGIEALKHFKYHRDLNIISFVKLLPGETPPGDSP